MCVLRFSYQVFRGVLLATAFCFATPILAQQPPQETARPTPEVQEILTAGMTALNARRFEEAEKQFLQALSLARKKSDKRGEADALRRLGTTVDRINRIDEALSYQQQALTLYRELKDRLSEGGTLSNIAGLYRRSQKIPIAIDYYQQSLKIFEELGDRFWIANTLLGLGVAYNASSRQREAIVVYEKALPLLRERNARNLEAATLTNLANAWYELGETQRAYDLYQQALPIHRETDQQENLANTLGGIANVLEKRGTLDQAIRYNEEALTIFRSLKLPVREQIILSNLGRIYFETNRLEKAQTCVEQSLKICQDLSLPLSEATAWHSLGSIHEQYQRYLPALSCYQRARTLQQRSHEKRRESETLRAIGGIYDRMGQKEMAKEAFEQALKIAGETGDRDAEMRARITLGNYYSDQKDITRALQQYEAALTCARILQSKSGEASLWYHIGLVQTVSGQVNLAELAYQKALPLYRALQDPGAAGGVLSNLGFLYYQKGAREQARRACEQGMTLLNRTPLLHSRSLTHTRLGIIYAQRKQDREADTHFQEGIRLLEQERNGFGALTEARLAQQGETLFGYRHYLDFLLTRNRQSEAFAVAQKMKARSLLELTANGRPAFLSGLSDEERMQVWTLRHQTEELIHQMLAESVLNNPGSRQRYSALAQELARKENEQVILKASLLGKHPELQPMEGGHTVTLAEAASQLPPDSALIEFVALNNRTAIFVVSQDRGKPALSVAFLSAAAESVQEKVADFRLACGDPRQRYAVKAQDLYRLLLGSVERSLRNKKRLILCPDDIFWEVPFAALMVAPKTFLIDRYDVTYSYSASALQAVRSRRKSQPAGDFSLLALANPAFGALDRFKQKDDSVALMAQRPIYAPDRPAGEENMPLPGVQRDLWTMVRAESLAPLKGAQQEAETIQKAFPNARVLTGEQAQESTFKAEAGKYRYLHLASHAFFNGAAPMLSNIVLAVPPTDSEDDGLLTAREILDLHLRAELCVLSACNTSRGGKNYGEGIVGLTWALFVAGVPTQIVSQWSVDDAATGELMSRFYRRLQPTPAKSAALREACLALKRDEKYRHPYYWAPFILIGDGG